MVASEFSGQHLETGSSFISKLLCLASSLELVWDGVGEDSGSGEQKS